MMESTEGRRTVLTVDQVTLFADGQRGGDYMTAHFDLYNGQLALARLENLGQTAILADVFSGLVPPHAGRVLFVGRDWQRSSDDMLNAMRGRIGRVFSSGNWLEGLSLVENILLPQLHHTRRPLPDLRGEAARLARQFGLPGLPLGAPDKYSRADLQRSACVRAFLGTPLLLLLEDPTFGLYPRIVPALVNAIRQVRNQGAAVVWMTLAEEVWRDTSIPADRLFRMAGRNLTEVNRHWHE
ncbi:MAG: ATP-binding cassette domain-containing protein [Desulfobacterales bacterium]